MVRRLSLGLIAWLVAGSLWPADSAPDQIAIYLPPTLESLDGQKQLVQALKALLNETSWALHRATGEHFRKVVFVIPGSWGKWEYDYFDQIPEENVLVTSSSDSVFGPVPYTVQFGTCGTKGFRIYVPKDFLMKPNQEIAMSRAKLLTREWIKYRHGVFDEHGFWNDARYPTYYVVPGMEAVKVTDCTNIPVKYLFRDKSGSECRPDVNAETGLPDAECQAQPDPDENENVTSSLMYLQPLRNVEFLCGDEEHPHQSLSPNKQNVLCKGRSIKDVLKGNTNLQQQRLEDASSLPSDPVFRFAKDAPSRVVVAADISASLAKYKDLIRNSLTNLVYSLPSGSVFGISTAAGLHTFAEAEDLKETNNVILEMQAGIIFNKPESCPECALRKAVELLRSSSDEAFGSIILITAANPANLGPDLLQQLKSPKICLTAILFSGATAEAYAAFAGAPCGRVISLPPDDASFAMLGILYEVMDHSISPLHTKKVKLKATEISQQNGVDFIVDQSMASFNLWFSNRSSEMEIDASSLSVYSESGVEPKVKQLTAVPNFRVLQVENNAAGKWTCSLKFDSPLYLKVTAELRDADPLVAEAWAVDTTPQGTSTQMPVMLFARITKGVHPVIGASVKAVIKVPHGDSVFFDLLDNGLGDPDITKNDGIYSRYFVHFTTAGEYEVTIEMNDNKKNAKLAKPNPEGSSAPCCGSEVPIGRKEDLQPFHRAVKLYFTGRGQYPNNGFSPSTILDLQAKALPGPLFKLRWTAPGGKKDHDRAAKYVLRQHQNYESLIFDQTKEKPINGFESNDKEIIPQKYGESEEMELRVAKTALLNSSYFLLLTSLNENGVESDPSNVVEVFLQLETKDQTSDGNTTSPTTDGERSKNNKLSSATIGYIAGAVAICVLIACGYIAFSCYVKRREKSEDQERPTPEGNTANNNNNNGDESSAKDGSVTSSGWWLDRDAISPVNSVPASVLLYHHEQVKDAKRKNKRPPQFKLEQLSDNGDSLNRRPTESSFKSQRTGEEGRDTVADIAPIPEEHSKPHNSNTEIAPIPEEYGELNDRRRDTPAKPRRKVTNV